MKPLTDSTALWPLALYGGAVLLVVMFMLGLSHFLGQRHQEGATSESYESGILSSGSGRLRFAVSFYLIAVFFLIFDLEAVFIFAWAVVARELGWAGYIEIMIFIGVLMAALVYLWCLGALDWGPVKGNLSATRPINKGNSCAGR